MGPVPLPSAPPWRGLLTKRGWLLAAVARLAFMAVPRARTCGRHRGARGRTRPVGACPRPGDTESPRPLL